MKASELRNRPRAELDAELVNLRREQFNLRMQLATGQLNRHSEYARVRKDIARLKTVMTELAAKGDAK